MATSRSEAAGRIVVAATGGVAAIKTPLVIRRLQEAGFEVRAAATDDAYRFVTPLALATAAGGEVLDREAWFRPDGAVRHLEWARWADVLLVAPASADALATAASGGAGDPVAALVLSGPSRVVWAPAMNEAMWRHPAVRRNVARLREDGQFVLEPGTGRLGGLAEGAGAGRMPEPEALVEAVQAALAPRDYQGISVVVSAGPTRERLDPVRYLSNPSSGRMGWAIATAARDRGAEVTLVSGPSDLPDPHGVAVTRVESAEEMLAALEAPFARCQLLVMAAAVSDWRPERAAAERVPKQGEWQVLELVRTPDVLERLGARRGRQVMVGFAMETDAGVERAADKARRKGLAFVGLNYPAREESGFGGEHGRVTWVTPEGRAEELPRLAKREVAERLLDRARPLLEPRASPA